MFKPYLAPQTKLDVAKFPYPAQCVITLTSTLLVRLKSPLGQLYLAIIGKHFVKVIGKFTDVVSNVDELPEVVNQAMIT